MSRFRMLKATAGMAVLSLLAFHAATAKAGGQHVDAELIQPAASVTAVNAEAGCCEPEPTCRAAPECREKPCISYRYRGCRKVCCGCPEPIKTVLKVTDPRTCCVVDVPVCLPGCCKGDPTVCSRRGIFCRGVVHHDYCCGFRVKVTFKACGDLVVTYIGR